MISRLRKLWQSIAGSLWALPLAMMLAAVALAVLAVTVRFEHKGDAVWWLYSGDDAEAPQFLSSLLTAMITMATLAISITMVVLTLAAQQLGPRLIRSFMGDRKTQLSLGLLLGTVVYLLVVLRSVYGISGSVPNVAVTLGTLLVFISVVVALLFVHHLARSIVADNVVQRIGAFLDCEIDRLLPESESAGTQAEFDPTLRAAPLTLSRGGYVEAIDFDLLVELVETAGAAVKLDIRAGHHVISGRPIGWIAPAPPSGSDLPAEIERAILLGAERTPLQDLEFSFRQMVEIAVRALSPGINDPFTAMTVVDRLAECLARAMRRGAAQSVWTGSSGRLRVVVPVSTFDGLADVAFNQIRQRAEGSADVLIRMAENITELLQGCDDRQRRTLRRHLKLIGDAGERSIGDAHDLGVLKSRIDSATAR